MMAAELTASTRDDIGSPQQRRVWVALALVASLVGVAVLLTVWQYAGGVEEPFDYWLEGGLGALAYAAMGALIATRVPSNRLGRLMLGVGAAEPSRSSAGPCPRPLLSWGWRPRSSTCCRR